MLRTLGDELELPEENQIVRVGRAHYEIIEQAKTLNMDAVVIGSHTPHSGFAHLHLLGSTANAIVQHAHCDVITLRVKQATSKGASNAK